MVLTPSSMLPLSTPLPDFNLLDTVSGKQVSADSFQQSLLLVGFICNHCPFVVHILPKLVSVCQEFQQQGVDVVMISSNDPTSHPQDGPEKMTQHAKKSGFTFPYLFDASQSVAKSFDAACTPEFYLFDQSRKLVYRGQFDNARPGSPEPVTGHDLITAVELGLQQKIYQPQKPSVGCNIKWKSQ